jgi:hypothetical protein
MKLYIVIISLFLFSCSTNKKEAEKAPEESRTDTMEIIRGFIYGLWSMDTGNYLLNEGYYFKPDGSVDFVAAAVSGEWKLVSKDSIKISYSSYDQNMLSILKIDSLNNERMVLSDSDGAAVFRKVPFGIDNMEGIVLQGFAGTLEKGEQREYSFNVPSAKKIQLKLKSSNQDVTFHIYEGNNIITSTPVRDWTAIMIRGGNYRAIVTLPKNSASKEDGKFDLKVVGY